MDVRILADLLVEAEKAHKQFETTNGPDSDWPMYYAKYLAGQIWRAGNVYPDGVHTKNAQASWKAHMRKDGAQ